MNKEIELNKVYADGRIFRLPVSIMNGAVLYWWTVACDEIEKAANSSQAPVECFLENNKLYKKPMTFQRIKDEGIKKLEDEIGQQKEVMGFASDGSLVTYMTNWGLLIGTRARLKNGRLYERYNRPC